VELIYVNNQHAKRDKYRRFYMGPVNVIDTLAGGLTTVTFIPRSVRAWKIPPCGIVAR
jgi:hypothetical protein